MSGSGFPEGLCTLLVNHHAISQPSTASWILAFSSQRLSGPCYSQCRVACMLRSNGSRGTCIPQGITTFLHYASRRSAAPQYRHRVHRCVCASFHMAVGISMCRTVLPRRELGFGLDWLTSQARYVRVSVPRRAMHASCESPWHLSAKHCVLKTCLLLTAPFRAMLLTS